MRLLYTFSALYRHLRPYLIFLACVISQVALAADLDNDGIDSDVDANDRIARYHVSAGDRHTCTLSDEGVFCWGFNFNKRTETPTLSNPIQVSAGYNHTCALDDDGVTCWGSNYQGQAAPPALLNPTMVSTGGYFSCALEEDGVTCWGLNDYLQLDVPSLTNPVTVTAGANHACAIDDSGVICWGDDTNNQSAVPALSGSVLDINARNHSTCALTTTGVTCWGDVSTQQTVPPLENPVQISTGNLHACALDDSGVICWGDNSSGQTDVPALSNPYQVSSGGAHSCALDDNGLTCWGDNAAGAAVAPRLVNPQVVSIKDDIACAIDNGQVQCWGRGDLLTPTPALSNATEIELDLFSACAVDDNGVSCWDLQSKPGFENPPAMTNPHGISVTRTTACALNDGPLKCWSSSTTDPLVTDAPSMNGAVSVSIGLQHACATNGTDTVTCWGLNSVGQASPTVTDNVTEIAAGGTHTCAIAGGTVACWGDSSQSKLLVPSLANPTRLFANESYTCALHDGGLKCWGAIGYLYPKTSVALSNPLSASASARNICVIDDNGLDCWGQNHYSTSSVPYLRHFADHDGDGVPDDTDSAPYDPTVSSPNSSPIAVLSATYETTQYATLQLDASLSYDSDGSITAWHWDFDSSDGIDFDSPDAIGEKVDTSYNSADTYTVSMRVTDDRGAVDITTTSVTVSPDTDADGITDSNDDFPSEGSATVDADGDGLPDDCSSAQACIDDGLTPDPSLDDFDNDGIASGEDSDDTTDTAPPSVTAAADINIEASGVVTTVDLLQNGASYASDFPNTVLSALPNTASNATSVDLESGRHLIDWCASDAAGNSACATQTVDIIPLVTFTSATQTTAEGVNVDVTVTLSGNPISYPVTVPLLLDASSTAATPDDHNASSGVLQIVADVPDDALDANTAVYSFQTVDDGVTGEANETVVLKLTEDNGSETLAGAALGETALLTHTVTITEENVTPVVTITADSDISLAAASAEYSININDPNNHPNYLVSWYFDGALLQSGNNLTEITHDLTAVSAGTYSLRVTVLDSGDPAKQGEAELEISFTAPANNKDSGGGGFAVLVMGGLLLLRKRDFRALHRRKREQRRDTHYFNINKSHATNNVVSEFLQS